MNSQSILSIFVLLIWGYSKGSSAFFRILGGDRVKIEDYPYVVSLQLFRPGLSKHLCGGTLITSRFVISAAHCFRPGLNYVIRAGSADLYGRDGCMVPVSMFRFHPNYTFMNQDYDIAVAMLRKPVKLSDKIQPVKLPSLSKMVPLELGTVLGWGGTISGEQISKSLKAVEIPIIDDKACVRSYPKGLVTERMFCAVDKMGRKDSCQGDSGGPLEINGTIYGIVSWGFGCGNPENPGVYTKVPYFVDFINNSIKEMSFRYYWNHKRK
ncbi:hypothetical protein WA026_016777 [Henosepilachna vigintioctopunctata]|uniref:Peptidase S1 domain-containing protein n=1 Tax=Henosepilachna vigintioctopunctata TaxID=420089 RepID=A0AAW1USP1_9CUCU